MELTKQAIDQLQAEVNHAIYVQTEELVSCHFHTSWNPKFQLLSNLKNK